MNKNLLSKYLIPFSLIFLITVYLYSQVFNFEFLTLDDPEYILHNPFVRQGLNWDSFIWALTTNYYTNWAPVTWLSHLITVELFGFDSGFHHLVNLGIHVLNAFLLYVLFIKFTKDQLISLMIAIVFAIHPVNVEPVAWVSSRKDLLATFWANLTFYSYVFVVEKKKNALIFFYLCFFLSLASKPVLITLPLLLLCFDYWPLNRQIGIKKLIIEKVPIFLVSIIFTIIHTLNYTSQHIQIAVEEFGLGTRLINSIYYLFTYISRFVIPDKLSIFYPKEAIDPLSSSILLLVFIVLLIIFISIVIKKDRKAVMIGYTFFIITLLPFLQLVSVGVQSMADRWVYLPQVGLILVLVTCINRTYKNRLITSGLFLLVIICFFNTTSSRIPNWKNSLLVFNDAISNYPEESQLYIYRAPALDKLGDQKLIIDNYVRALELNANEYRAVFALAKMIDSPRKLFSLMQEERLFSLQANYIEEHFYRGKILSIIDKFPKHREYFTKQYQQEPIKLALMQCDQALKKQPEYTRILHLRGQIHFNTKDYELALKDFQLINQTTSPPAALISEAVIMLLSQEYSEAEKLLLKAVKVFPYNANGFFELANAQMGLKKHALALNNYRKALFLNPFNKQAREMVKELSS